jgi:hypothetical protein
VNEYIYDPVALSVQAYLRDCQRHEVGIIRPEEIPRQFIQVQVAGGTTLTISQRVLVLITCWGESEADAMKLASATNAHMKQCKRLAGLPVYRVKTVGLPVPNPSSDPPRRRYQFTLEISVRGRIFAP